MGKLVARLCLGRRPGPSARAVGPLLTVLLVGAVELVGGIAGGGQIPPPASLLVALVVVSALFGGWLSAALSAAVALAYSALTLSSPAGPFTYVAGDAARLVFLALALPVIAGVTLALRAVASNALTAASVAAREAEVTTARLNALLAQLPAAAAELDRDGRIRWSAGRLLASVGVAAGQNVGRSFLELYPGPVADAAAEALAGRSVTLRTSKGDQVLDVAFVPLVSEGRHTGALGVAFDATAIAAHDELDRRARLADVLERMGDAFVALDREWRYTYMNGRAGELFERDPAAMLGRHIWTEFPEGVGQPFQRAYERVMGSGVSETLEEHYSPWDRWFENRIFPTADGIAIFFTEITQRKRAERERQRLIVTLHEQSARLEAEVAARTAELAASEGRFRTLFDLSPVALVIVRDADSTVLDANRRFLEVFVLPRGEVVGRRVSDLISAPHDPAAIERLRALGALEGETVFVPRNREPFLAVVNTAIVDLAGVRSRVTGLIDVTEQRRAQMELAHAHERLRSVEVEREEFLSIVAHELRTPVAAIDLLARGLEEGAIPAAGTRDALDALRSQAGRLAVLAEDVLAISALDGGQLALDIAPRDLRPIVRDVVGRLHDRERVRVRGDGVAVVASIDAERMGQVVDNLVTNALKYSDGLVDVVLSADAGGVCLSVNDGGVGIDPDDVPRLFQKYSRIDGQRRRGVGLGLYLVRMLVERHGGTVEVASPGRGRGSSFTVRLPAVA